MGRIFIVDGHNVIFAIPRLRRLQDAGQGEAAREALLEALRRLASTPKRFLVVFDGSVERESQSVVRESRPGVIYARRRPGGADERILREARALLDEGHRVTVVTNDVITLARLLPKAADHERVRPFWERYVEGPEQEAGKTIEGDFSDLEKEMLARAAREPVSARPAAAGASRTGGRETPTDTLRERLRLKRERGRARQQRRLRRR